MCHMSGVSCQVSGVRCQVSGFTVFFVYKEVELVGKGSGNTGLPRLVEF